MTLFLKGAFGMLCFSLYTYGVYLFWAMVKR